MEKLDEMTQIAIAALSILERLSSNNVDTVRTAIEDHLELVNRFYRENYNFMTSPQYEVARMDLAHFLRLVYLALEYYGGEE